MAYVYVYVYVYLDFDFLLDNVFFLVQWIDTDWIHIRYRDVLGYGRG